VLTGIFLEHLFISGAAYSPLAEPWVKELVIQRRDAARLVRAKLEADRRTPRRQTLPVRAGSDLRESMLSRAQLTRKPVKVEEEDTPVAKRLRRNDGAVAAKSGIPDPALMLIHANHQRVTVKQEQMEVKLEQSVTPAWRPTMRAPSYRPFCDRSQHMMPDASYNFFG
jgi:hypothetical protein